jgi:hypothetical protein
MLKKAVPEFLGKEQACLHLLFLCLSRINPVPVGFHGEDAIVAAYKHELGGMPVVPVAFQAWIRALYPSAEAGWG